MCIAYDSATPLLGSNLSEMSTDVSQKAYKRAFMADLFEINETINNPIIINSTMYKWYNYSFFTQQYTATCNMNKSNQNVEQKKLVKMNL